MIVVGLQATQHGVFTIPGFVLHYRVGVAHYEAPYRTGAYIQTAEGPGPALPC